MLYALTELTFKKCNAIRFKNVNLLKKAMLYALKKLEFAIRFKKVRFRIKPSLYAFKKLNFAKNSTLYGLKTLDFGITLALRFENIKYQTNFAQPCVCAILLPYIMTRIHLYTK